MVRASAACCLSDTYHGVAGAFFSFECCLLARAADLIDFARFDLRAGGGVCVGVCVCVGGGGSPPPTTAALRR